MRNSGDQPLLRIALVVMSLALSGSVAVSVFTAYHGMWQLFGVDVCAAAISAAALAVLTHRQ
jgi:hypothetical protein